jgi:hypothetical protein
MATYTRIQLNRAVLAEIGALDPHETMEADDQAQSDAVCQQELERLHDEGLAQFDIDGAIPARLFRPLVMAIAPLLAPSYGLGSPMLEATGAEGIRRLRKLAQAPALPTPVEASYF